MTPEDFARHVKACNSLSFNKPGYDERANTIGHYLAEQDVPVFWHEPIRVMTMGGYYYGADAWMANHGED